ncbi:transcription factor Ouib isoform X1 [Drosophila innubila]|uniref:transcription factor Ouib isoform X1 n=1 Tax=Drosophila innubila TaxID=198719 RepID=UPI00148E76FC|nr:transcription factor Ouib isoform X1 [Drosophila innubila]
MSEKMCRICLVDIRSSSSRVDIFTEQNVHLIRQIYSITGVQLTNISDQPRHMCITCLMNLGTAIKFRQRCIISQKQLRAEDHPKNVFYETIDINHDVNDHFESDDSAALDIIEKVHEVDYEVATVHDIEEDSDSQIDYYFTTTEQTDDNNVEQSDKESEHIEVETQCKFLDKVKKSKKEAINCKPNRSTSNNPVRSFVCDECGKKLSNISNFREHKLRHAGIKRFICKLCRKSFTTQKELTRHTRGHTGERPYACRYCPSRFADLGTIRQHERRHTNTRPFECAVCGKSFFSSNSLSKHRLRHQDMPRTHHCTICDIWFQRPDHLAAHMNCRSHKIKEQVLIE